MNEEQWNKTIYELESMVKNKDYANAEKHLTFLHESFFTQQQELTQEEYYAVLLNIASSYVSLGTAANNNDLLSKGNAILEKHKNDFTRYSHSQNSPQSSKPLIKLTTYRENLSYYKKWRYVIILLAILVIVLFHVII